MEFKSHGLYTPFHDESSPSLFPFPPHFSPIFLSGSKKTDAFLFAGTPQGFPSKKIDAAVDERYDTEVKAAKNQKEVLVFVMEMSTSLTVCLNLYGI